jgi:hypothetical protein
VVLGGNDWVRLLILAAVLVLGAVGGIRRLFRADETDIKRRITAKGVTVLWARRLDTQADASFNRNATVTYYNVLVERDGVRRIEVWRDSLDGLFPDH